MTTANVVFSARASETPIVEEKVVKAANTILPGYLVVTSSGEWALHGTEGQASHYRIANMNYIESKSVTEALTIGDTAQAFVPVPGQNYNVVVADGETVVVDSPLTSNGDGTCKVAATDGTEEVMFYANEAASPSGSTARVNARVATAGFNQDTDT